MMIVGWPIIRGHSIAPELRWFLVDRAHFTGQPTPALRISNPLAALGGSRPRAGAAVVCASPAAAKALALARMSRPRLGSARLPP
jgi:hypothetical protein